METEIKELNALFTQATAEFKKARENHEAEVKAAGEATAEVKAALESAEKKLNEQFAAMDAKLIEMEKAQKRSFDLSPKSRKSIGSQFVEHAL